MSTIVCDTLSAEDAEAHDIENWPGFGKACDEIRGLLDAVREDLFLDLDAELWSDVEPDDECADLYTARVERGEQVKALVGRELAPYVR